MMRVFGYDSADCKRSVLDGYRPAAYIGFIVGSIYQYALLKIMVGIVFAGFEASVLKAAFQIPSLAATYERKSRLKDSITRSSSPHKEHYLRFFK